MRHIVKPKYLSSVVAAVTVGLLIGAAPALAETLQCEAQPFSQPFLFAKDTSNYVLVPGESANDFEGAGWELSGGAKIVQGTLANGSTGSVLQMPGGSKAVSPAFCVTTEYPTARTMIDDVEGAQGVTFAVGYEGKPTWKSPHNSGQVHGGKSEWTTSAPLNMQPENVQGWQHVRITLSANGNGSVYQIYNLYVDPYSR